MHSKRLEGTISNKLAKAEEVMSTLELDQALNMLLLLLLRLLLFKIS